jgi:hypothetical protein
MPDPFESLKHLDEGVAGPALPSSEVRRRGDRMRRRRTALRVAAAACAVAVVTTGGIALGGNLTGSTPAPPPPSTQDADPTPEPSEDPTPEGGWRTEIPRGFPLAEGFPEDRFAEDELEGPVPDESAYGGVRACDKDLFPTLEWKDALSTSFSQPEDFRGRILTTYADAAEARGVAAALAGGFRDCPRQSYGGTPESVTLTDVVELGTGDEGWAVISTYEVGGAPAIGLQLLHVVRVGNAVLISSVANEGGYTQRDVDRQLDEQAPLVQGLVSQMCVFSAQGCESR